MAFGTLQNQLEFLARAHAWHMARRAKLDSARASPTATKIADMLQWDEEGVVHTSRIEVIQAVFDGNSGTHEASIQT
jgi:hypothetical protein